MEKKLNIDNPEYILWEHEQVRVAILGGIRIEGLDRMKVTLKIEWKELVVRHNLDLYNEIAVDRYSKREVQYKAGHKHISSTEKYAMQEWMGWRIN